MGYFITNVQPVVLYYTGDKNGGGGWDEAMILYKEKVFGRIRDRVTRNAKKKKKRTNERTSYKRMR